MTCLLAWHFPGMNSLPFTQYETLTFPQELGFQIELAQKPSLPLQLTCTLEWACIHPLIVGTSSVRHHKQVPENSMHLEQLPSNQILMRCQVALEWRWNTWFPKASIDTITIAPLGKSLKSLFLSRLGSFRLCLFCSSNRLLNNKQQNWNETHSSSSHIEVKWS